MADKKLGLLDQIIQGAKGLGNQFLEFTDKRAEESRRKQQEKDDFLYYGDPRYSRGIINQSHGYGNDPSIRPQDAFTRENMSPEMVDYLTNYFGQNGLDNPAKFLMYEFNYLNQDLRKDIYNLFKDNYKAPPVPLFDRKPGIGL